MEEENKYHFAREIIFNLRACQAITDKVYLHWIDKLIEDEKQAKNNESLHLVSHTVIYDNFGRDWREPKEKYQIMEVLKDGYLIGNEYTKPFFAYEYQIKTCG